MEQKIMLAAHRGYSAAYPENTMLAFREALKLDIDMIETDVHMTSDGVLVLMHDHVMERTTDMKGPIVNYTYAEVEKADAGSWKDPRFKGEEVPKFTELLDLLKDRPDIELNVELKDYPKELGAHAYECADKVMAVIEEYGMLDRCMINSFSGDLLNYIYTKYPGKIRLHGYYPVRFLGDQFNENIWNRCYCVCLFNVTFDENGKGDWSNNREVCPQEAFDRVASHGAQCWHYYKEEHEEIFRTAIERGTTAFTCNDPVKAAAILKKLGKR